MGQSRDVGQSSDVGQSRDVVGQSCGDLMEELSWWNTSPLYNRDNVSVNDKVSQVRCMALSVRLT